MGPGIPWIPGGPGGPAVHRMYKIDVSLYKDNVFAIKKNYGFSPAIPIGPSSPFVPCLPISPIGPFSPGAYDNTIDKQITY